MFSIFWKPENKNRWNALSLSPTFHMLNDILMNDSTIWHPGSSEWGKLDCGESWTKFAVMPSDAKSPHGEKIRAGIIHRRFWINRELHMWVCVCVCVTAFGPAALWSWNFCLLLHFCHHGTQGQNQGEENRSFHSLAHCHSRYTTTELDTIFHWCVLTILPEEFWLSKKSLTHSTFIQAWTSRRWS